MSSECPTYNLSDDVTKVKASYTDGHGLSDLKFYNTEDKKMFDLVDRLNFTNLQEVEKYLNNTSRENMIEGVVVKYYMYNALLTLDTCHRFKWKTQAYLDVHRTRQKLSKKSIFQALTKSDEDAEEMRNKISEEFYHEFDQTVEEYRNKIYLALARAKTILGVYRHAVENECQEDSKAKLVEWLDNIQSRSQFKKRDKSLILKAYADGMDTFEKSWIQEKKPVKVNRDRKFLFNYISVKTKNEES